MIGRGGSLVRDVRDICSVGWSRCKCLFPFIFLRFLVPNHVCEAGFEAIALNRNRYFLFSGRHGVLGEMGSQSSLARLLMAHARGFPPTPFLILLKHLWSLRNLPGHFLGNQTVDFLFDHSKTFWIAVPP